MPNAFINYRRSDAAQSAQALHTQLRTRFGPSAVFFDVSAILPGSMWPSRLESAVASADVLISVIGPRWLTAANEYGQRRLDNETDWVRKEIAHAISARIPIIPLLVAGANELPPLAALPADITDPLGHQYLKLRDEKLSLIHI